MDRTENTARAPKPAMRRRKKVCIFCVDKGVDS